MITIKEALEELCEIKREGNLAIFVGSGISTREPSNLPTWKELLEWLVNFCKQKVIKYCPEDEKMLELVSDAETDSNNDSIKIITVLRNSLEQYPKEEIRNFILNEFKIEFNKIFAEAEFNKMHEKIISLNLDYIITTNYDQLLEKAYFQNRYHLNLGEYKIVSFNEAPKLADIIYNNQKAIIHMHGIAGDIGLPNIILTKSDYDKIMKQHYPGFSLALKAIFLSKTILFLGYGDNDPHIDDIISELKVSFGDSMPKMYLVRKISDTNSVVEKYNEMYRKIVIGVDSYDDYDILLDGLQCSD